MKSFTTVNIGVQFKDGQEDILLAGLLFLALNNRSCSDLAKVAFDISRLKEELVALVSENGSDRKMSSLISYQQTSKPFCRTTRKSVGVYCLCQTTWIEGSTAKAIYGPQLKEYNAHSCCECGNWFHNHCLKACRVSVPKRTEDFLCPYCKKMPVIAWGHPKYTNTCTVDNFLQIILVACHQNSDLPKFFGCSESELALKASMAMLLKGDTFAGKELMLEHLNSLIGFPRGDNAFNCYGSEYANCLTAFSNVWKLHLSLHCCSPDCPKSETDRFPCGFNLDDKNAYSDQIENQFPVAQSLLAGYCGATFKSKPGKRCDFEVSTKLDVESGNEIDIYVCTGQLLVKKARFVSKSPWLLPFSIASLSGNSLLDLPITIKIFNKNYTLAGFSMHRPGHYTAVIVWRGKKYYYDGLHKQFSPLRHEQLDHDGGFAYYIMDTTCQTLHHSQGFYY